MNFYIADTHFGHRNIIRYDNRPFSTAEEMNIELIERWNKVVGKDDTVYILGDFVWLCGGNSERKLAMNELVTLEILDRLKGKKVLIKGNHDYITPEVEQGFAKVCDYLEIRDGFTRVIMRHYPMPFWNGQFHDSVHLYGHVHNSHQENFCQSWRKELQQIQDIPMRMYNVGCMMEYMDYTPRTLSEIEKAR